MAGEMQPNPWRYAHMGLELGGSVGLLAAAGYWVDWRFGTGPWGVVTGTCVGFIGGMYLFIKQALAATSLYRGTGRQAGKQQDGQHRDGQ
ncbi:MAG: AtpZ/AtpI family protein [Phycisphaeraceae bacterium]